MIIYSQDQFILEKDARLSPLDRGMTLGDGVFDTLLAIDGVPVLGQRHFKRLLDHGDILQIPAPKNTDELLVIAARLLQENGFLKGAYAIRTTMTRGVGARGLVPPDSPEPSLFMTAAPAPDRGMQSATRLITSTIRRNEFSPLSRIKSLNYGDNILALLEARQKNADEALMLNTKGKVTCTTSGNIFVLLNGKLYTPPLEDGVMNGIMRGMLIEKADAQEETLKPEDLLRSDGIYITSSLLGIRPVKSLDDEMLSPLQGYHNDLQAFLSAA